MLNPKLPDAAAWEHEVNRLPDRQDSLAMLQRLPRHHLKKLAHGLISHVGDSLRRQDLLEALESLNGWYSIAQAMAEQQPEIDRYNNYLNDISQIGHLEKLISEAPPEAVISKRSLEYRLQQVKDQVAALGPEPTMPEPPAWPQERESNSETQTNQDSD